LWPRRWPKCPCAPPSTRSPPGPGSSANRFTMRRLPKKLGPDRRRAERAGRRAETLAALFLRLKLYRIVAMRYKTPVGEIDIVARRGRMLVLVEVKQRAGSPMAHAQALEAVNAGRIIAAAGWF